MTEVYREPAVLTGVRYAIDRSYIRYLLQLREAWARSYSQWIGQRAVDPILQGQVRTIVQRTAASPVPLPSQWGDDDFEPIAAEIDKQMRAMEWM